MEEVFFDPPWGLGGLVTWAWWAGPSWLGWG